MSTTDPAAPGQRAKSDPLILLSYVTIVGVWAASQFVLIPYMIHLLVLVMSILYVACHNSLILREDIPKEGEVGYDPDAPPSVETLRKEDAMQFPIVGSMCLFGLYLAFKFLGQDLVNLLIGAYFGAVGCGALTLTMAPWMYKLLPTSMNEMKLGWKKKISSHPFPEWILPKEFDFGIEFSGIDMVAFLLASVIVALYFQKKHWALNNVLGICFCLQGIEKLSLGTYKIGAILLVGLFFYDIFWVFGTVFFVHNGWGVRSNPFFCDMLPLRRTTLTRILTILLCFANLVLSLFAGTDVMVTVAKNLDGPIKLLFPRSLVPHAETGKVELSLLGLGDIVIPGFFLALLLRFDAENAKMPTSKINVSDNFPKPYFYSALIAYFLGLATTLFVMVQFQAAQPALLYLVPACLGSSFLCALIRGEVTALLAYSEEVEEEEAEEGDVKDKASPPKPEETKKDD